jgi:hypothetical protein
MSASDGSGGGREVEEPLEPAGQHAPVWGFPLSLEQDEEAPAPVAPMFQYGDEVPAAEVGSEPVARRRLLPWAAGVTALLVVGFLGVAAASHRGPDPTKSEASAVNSGSSGSTGFSGTTGSSTATTGVAPDTSPTTTTPPKKSDTPTTGGVATTTQVQQVAPAPATTAPAPGTTTPPPTTRPAPTTTTIPRDAVGCPLSVCVHSPDINGDGVVDKKDYRIFHAHYGQNYPPAEIDGTSTVTLHDFSILASYYRCSISAPCDHIG